MERPLLSLPASKLNYEIEIYGTTFEPQSHRVTEFFFCIFPEGHTVLFGTCARGKCALCASVGTLCDSEARRSVRSGLDLVSRIPAKLARQSAFIVISHVLRDDVIPPRIWVMPTLKSHLVRKQVHWQHIQQGSG